MLKEMFKRGFYGILSSTFIAFLFIMLISIISKEDTITLNIEVLIKNFISFTFIIFLVFSSSIIFNIKKVSLLTKTIFHCVISSFFFIQFLQKINVTKEDYLIQALVIAIFFIFYGVFWFFHIYTNKKTRFI